MNGTWKSSIEPPTKARKGLGSGTVAVSSTGGRSDHNTSTFAAVSSYTWADATETYQIPAAQLTPDRAKQGFKPHLELAPE